MGAPEPAQSGGDTASAMDVGAGGPVELELWPRQHDLPPRWDGLPVEWGEWSDAADVYICPPPRKRSRCCRCGSCCKPRMSLGRGLTELESVSGSVPARLVNGERVEAHLAVFRCPECEHDYVLDFANDEAWDLDPTDYTDSGSYDVQQARAQRGVFD